MSCASASIDPSFASSPAWIWLASTSAVNHSFGISGSGQGWNDGMIGTGVAFQRPALFY